MAKDEVYIFYGSQTGQAEAIAETIHEAAEEHEIKSTIMCLWKAEEVFKIISERSVTAVIVCSTTGDGELPGNVRKFMRIIGRKTLDNDHLSKFRYALLGLGDTNYSMFCGGPKTLEKGLKKLKAKSYYSTGYADDGTDMEIVVEPWIEGLWPALKLHLKKLKSAASEYTLDATSGLSKSIEDCLHITSAKHCDSPQKRENGSEVEGNSEKGNNSLGSFSEVKSCDQGDVGSQLRVKGRGGQENGLLEPSPSVKNQCDLEKMSVEPDSAVQGQYLQQNDSLRQGDLEKGLVEPDSKVKGQYWQQNDPLRQGDSEKGSVEPDSKVKGRYSQQNDPVRQGDSEKGSIKPDFEVKGRYLQQNDSSRQVQDGRNCFQSVLGDKANLELSNLDIKTEQRTVSPNADKHEENDDFSEVKGQSVKQNGSGIFCSQVKDDENGGHCLEVKGQCSQENGSPKLHSVDKDKRSRETGAKPQTTLQLSDECGIQSFVEVTGGSITDNGSLIVSSVSGFSDLSTRSEGTLPPLMLRYVAYDFVQNESKKAQLSPVPCVPYPTAVDDRFYSAKIESVQKLTGENAVKTALCVTLEIPKQFTYEPGDSFCVLVQNRDQEVDWLVKRLKVEPDCDKTIALKIDSQTKKKNAKLPSYVPTLVTMRHVLKHCLEIRSVPKRAFLRALLEHTTSACDKNVLRQLCRKESMEEFIKYVREPNLNIIDVLASLPSCLPPFEVLLEHLPRLKPRLYSAASCMVAHPGRLRFVFNVVDFDASNGRMYFRKGLCTGYLAAIAEKLEFISAEKLSGENMPELTVFKTKNESFRLPEKLGAPVIMVGPGTGVAPYLGFLERLNHERVAVHPETWLFCGCRHKARDFLFQDELYSFVQNGTLSHLAVAFSRDSIAEGDAAHPRYVQDHLKLRSREILELLLRKNAVFYVCGDARNMAKDVREAVVCILQQEMTKDVAMETLKNLIMEGRYKEDVWT